ncbi:TIP41-like family-domain-containing protein [Dactylonectria macrodidyma]|uniref:TIP41-like family-domain-containing protein n=1 Tax=Dactylonectria macrodidyma TaxID=307937 RepID=A0A9P9FPN3_9HYPO|nr:TIP41-like family-domain-containing protein [Dactylonectria macrodidyma]
MASMNAPSSTPQVLAAGTTTHSQHNFRISTRKLPISKAGIIDDLTERVGIPMPEMIFGDNLVAITHVPSGWSLAFTTPDALDAVDKTDRQMLKVAYARDWESTRESTTQGIKEVVKPYDWSYSTDYTGTLDPAAEKEFQLSETPIPIELLKRRDPILFFDDVMLYESELDDNGISIFSVKVRVHDKRMLLLCRLFMRLDNVIVRVRDTRVYVDFETDEVIREYTAQEDTFDNVKRKLFMSGRLPDDITIALRDPNLLAPLLPFVEQRREAVNLKAWRG